MVKSSTLVTTGAGLLVVAALGVGGAAVAAAGNGTSQSAATTGYAGTTDDQTPGGAGRSGEGRGSGPTAGHHVGAAADALLSGETAVQVVQAAVTQEPDAKILRIAADPDGGYLAVMLREDGSAIRVGLDTSFSVTGVEILPAGAPARGGPGERGERTSAPGEPSASATPRSSSASGASASTPAVLS